MSKLQEIRDALVEISAGTVDLSYKEDGGMENVYLHAFMDQTEIAYQLLSTLDALMETHVLVPISPNKKAFKILWNINNFNSIDECCTFYETLIAAAQEQKDE